MSDHARREALVGIYRRLRRSGEDELMIRRALSVRPLQDNLLVARRFLSLHTALAVNFQQRAATNVLNIPRRMKYFLERKMLLFRLRQLRISQRSLAALSDALVMVVGVFTVFFAYQLYVVCRVGLNRAEEKFRILSIPIIQTIEALEMTERAKRDERKREMEEDILRQRNS